LTTVLGGTFAGVPTGTPVLTWIDGDQALALSTFLDRGGKPTGTVRSLNVSGPTSGNLMTASTVIWSGTLPWNQSGACHNMNNWPPSISANGKTITCVGIDMPEATQGHLDFETYPLAAGTAGDSKPTVVYRATIPPEKQTGGISAGILWVSPSADTLIIQWVPGGTLNVITAAKSAYFGVISHGKFIPLQIPKSLATETVQDITF
ncbi:MAG: hypothetical protein ACRDNW_13710, partial [Trebonia sp.]